MANFEDISANGTLTAAQASAATTPETKGACLSLHLIGGQGTVRITLGGTFTATTSVVQFEGTTDGINWFTIKATAPGSTTGATTATGTGSVQMFSGSCSAFTAVRVRCTTFTALDSITVQIKASIATYVAGF